MKLAYRLLGVLLLSLPLLSVVLVYDRLPTRLPIHFSNNGLPDKYGTKREWFVLLIITLFFLNVLRSLLIRAVEIRRKTPLPNMVALYILTAVSVSAIISLRIFEGVLGRPIYADWLPVLVFLSGAVFMYVSVPTELSIMSQLPEKMTPSLQRRVDQLQHIHMVSRLVVVRVNVLAAVLMVFVSPGDRWQLGLMANMLAYLSLFLMTSVMRRQAD
ncbi:DUF1648 domain-containing protein [Fibrella forsythiae]|uniref:DUF1648 domain-containing protein n=1 Tax=Fibrella forsythiae TaxID=2817061 RepID=A0ABS3JEU8_9BACT|nr:DUF1648 domain-containing protein [Fibrella forsythiae]MBO0948510.1 DUF1648 domain-containing protein [Fibrella forsythiae]